MHELQHLVIYFFFHFISFRFAICPCAIFGGICYDIKISLCCTVDRMTDSPKPYSKHDSFRFFCECVIPVNERCRDFDSD